MQNKPDIYYLDRPDLRQHVGLSLENRVIAQTCLSLGSLLSHRLDVLVVLGSSLRSLDRKSLDQLLALPTHLGCHFSEHAEFSLGLQTKGLDRLGNSHLLLLVIRSGDAVKHLEALKGSLTSGGLVRKHSTNSSPEHHRRGSVVKRASSRIRSGRLVLELLILELVSEQRAGNVYPLASHNSLRK